MKERFLRSNYGGGWTLTPNTGQIRLTVALVTDTHSLGAKDIAQRHTRVALGCRVNKQGLWEAGFVVSRGWSAPGYHRRMWLACLSYYVSWQRTSSLLRIKQEMCLVPLIRRVVWLKVNINGRRVGRGTCDWTIQGPLSFLRCQGST